ncbi:MAG: ribosome maturation factor RimM [Alphaproteobacteria bacterium]
MTTGDGIVALGKIVAGHGVRGLARVKPFNPRSPSLEAAEQLTVVDRSGRRREFAIVECRPHKGVYLVGLDGIDSLDALEPWIGSSVGVPGAELQPPGEGEIYHHEAIGLEVRTADGQRVGEVAAVETMPGNDLWVVRTDPDAEGRSRDCLVPAVAPILASVDLRARIAVIDPPPGLLDP